MHGYADMTSEYRTLPTPEHGQAIADRLREVEDTRRRADEFLRENPTSLQNSLLQSFESCEPSQFQSHYPYSLPPSPDYDSQAHDDGPSHLYAPSFQEERKEVPVPQEHHYPEHHNSEATISVEQPLDGPQLIPVQQETMMEPSWSVPALAVDGDYGHWQQPQYAWPQQMQFAPASTSFENGASTSSHGLNRTQAWVSEVQNQSFDESDSPELVHPRPVRGYLPSWCSPTIQTEDVQDVPAVAEYAVATAAGDTAPVVYDDAGSQEQSNAEALDSSALLFQPAPPAIMSGTDNVSHDVYNYYAEPDHSLPPVFDFGNDDFQWEFQPPPNVPQPPLGTFYDPSWYGMRGYGGHASF